ncbi:N-acetylmuramoyl-L-alanine amidase [Kitasatospora sp. SUK 42]|uniref:N-acetylmuramoyl-L-alanine amidase n=1 Tax=Kitasatospora sp. SUK 42 TaxID=1588882 RepID=UPI0018C982DC|nr:N-acetylmuramoyl-L-alanine amidase [Kitasatospora sp. SUK 42]MBV2153759.1 N-acetylmuramoyl-L-alanine amidase [Kitasatospora sp. SUK 42]
MTGPTSRPPRRSTLLRVTTVVAAAVPLCTAGWLGWQALDGSGPAGASASSNGTAQAGAQAATQSPATPGAPLTPPVQAAPPADGTPTGAPTATPAAPPSGTPTDPASVPAGGADLAGRTIVLDPGHNPGNVAHPTEINRQVDIGNARKECDTTGTETNAGYTEADYTLDVSRRARALLTARGAKVVLVQDGDRPWGPCIDERARAGADAHADVALSVHGDGGPASGSGFHVIMPAKVVAGKADNSAIVEPSHRLGLLLRERFQAATGEPYADYTAKDGLDVRSDLGGLNLSAVPKVFIECGNMRNSADARRMTDPQWRQQAAQGIADALTAFLTTR